MLRLGVFSLLVAASPAFAADLQVTVTNVREARGHVHIEVCSRATFTHKNAVCPYEADVKAKVGAVTMTFHDVTPGTYAIQVFHDLTDQHTVHQNFLGIPREPIGFSNDVSVFPSGPHWDKAAFQVTPAGARVTLKLRKI